MIEELESEIYLSISTNKFKIYLYDIKNLNNLYVEELIFENNTKNIDLYNLNKFLNNNIFKIEKLIGNFIKNIYLIIECDQIFNLNFGIKKKNYEIKINHSFLENILTDAKDIFKENYLDKKIMHMLIKNYIIDGKNYLSINDNTSGNNFCLEVEFKSIQINYISEIEKVLEKFQVKIIKFLDAKYIKNLSEIHNVDFSTMIFKIKNGFNDNEIKLIPKNTKKTGFFERFFQLFS